MLWMIDNELPPNNLMLEQQSCQNYWLANVISHGRSVEALTQFVPWSWAIRAFLLICLLSNAPSWDNWWVQSQTCIKCVHPCHQTWFNTSLTISLDCSSCFWARGKDRNMHRVRVLFVGLALCSYNESCLVLILLWCSSLLPHIHVCCLICFHHQYRMMVDGCN